LKKRFQSQEKKMLRVLVSSAKDLPNVETFGKSDPYTIVIFQGIEGHLVYLLAYE